MEIYEFVIRKDNLLRKIKELVDFSFIYDLSDVVERSRCDMSFKFVLDMAPEDEIINPSSLTKFRKLRLESVSDDMEHLETSKDGDAKTAHKTDDTLFFRYKPHIAKTEERIITAVPVTSGENRG